MQKSHNIWQVSHIPKWRIMSNFIRKWTSCSTQIVKPETMITNMPRASKSTMSAGFYPKRAAPKKKPEMKLNAQGFEIHGIAPLLKNKKKKYSSRAEKKTRRILERKSSEKEKRGLRMLIKNFVS